ncbi:MAG: hypothetical protein ACYDB6_03630 [Candidatus Limnocylindrales bacterium]
MWSQLVRWLPVPFIVGGGLYLGNRSFLYHASALGIDAHVYYSGTVAWLNGADPWGAAYHTLHYAALPWALPLIAPFTILSPAWFAALWIGLDIVASAYLVRRAGLSWAWLAFPPLIQGTLNGNPAIVTLALIVAGAAPIGLMLRPQAGYILIGERRWRAVALTILLALALVAILPLGTFLDDLPTILARYALESRGGSTGGSPIALAIGVASVLALATVDLREAGWLATIVAVPINGWYAGAAAIPIMNPLLAIGLSVPVVGLPVVTVATYAALRIALRWLPNGRLARLAGPFLRRYVPGAR